MDEPSEARHEGNVAGMPGVVLDASVVNAG